MIFQAGRSGIACRVQRVDYEFPAKGDNFDPPTVAAVVTLVARGVPGKSGGGNGSGGGAGGAGIPGGAGGEHEVSIRPATCAEFLVPRKKVLKVRERPPMGDRGCTSGRGSGVAVLLIGFLP